jgi:hypothetical protein
MASFDIKNMYTNMPTSEVLQIIKTILIHNHNDENIIDKILALVKATII